MREASLKDGKERGNGGGNGKGNGNGTGVRAGAGDRDGDGDGAGTGTGTGKSTGTGMEKERKTGWGTGLGARTGVGMETRAAAETRMGTETGGGSRNGDRSGDGNENGKQGKREESSGVCCIMIKKEYLCMVTIVSRLGINRPWSCQSCLWSAEGKIYVFFPSFTPKILVSRDSFVHPVSRQSTYSPYPGCIWYLLVDPSPYFRFLRWRPYVLSTAIGPSLAGHHANAYRYIVHA